MKAMRSQSQSTQRAHEWVQCIRERLESRLRGKKDIIELSLSAFLGSGHVLFEGPPGTGKTSLAKAMADLFGGSFKRLQMTSDLLPSDIIGVLRLVPGSPELEFRKGPVFANFLLADELNRTSSKTQSALLEAMAEGTVSVDGKSYSLPKPFFVAATQNPSEFQGVYPLAESQLDRFMLQLTLHPPEKSDELDIYRAVLGHDFPRGSKSMDSTTESALSPVLTIDQTLELRAVVSLVHVEDSVLEYASDLVRATRVCEGVSHGVSVRGGIQFLAAARALAFVRGREFVLPKDVADLAIPALAHRLCFLGGDPDTAHRQHTIRALLDRVKPPK